MTAATASTTHPDSSWLEELATYLGPGCFPATYDHLAATLIQRHAPSHLLWHLSALPRHRELQSFDDVVGQVAQSPRPAPQGSLGGLG